MILAAIVIVQAGSERLVKTLGLPSTLPASPLSIDLYALLLLVPMLAYDLIRYRKLHRAYAIWFGVELLPTAAMYMLTGSAWWFAVAPKLMGVE
jgi:hypothetical protein